jgi:hypothetical protein
MLHGQCHCGAIHYDMPDKVERQSLCHCSDCRRHSGAPMVAWAIAPADQVTIKGSPKTYKSSASGVRHFCSECGTGLFYTNEQVFPGAIDIQTATLDDPGKLQPPPDAHIQMADSIGWMRTEHELPRFDRYPGM